MSIRLLPFALALSLAACSQGGSQPAAAPVAKPEAAPPVTATPTTDRAAAAASPPASQPGVQSDRPAASTQPPAEPEFREVTIPAGTRLNVTLRTSVASDTSEIEDEVRGTLANAIVVDGVTAVPAGSEVIGTVREAKRSGRVKGRASVAFRFERLVVRDERLPIRTSTVSIQAEANRRDDVKKGVIGGAAGAVVGGIVGGGDGAAIGAGVGATGAIVATRGDEVRLDAGTAVNTSLQQPLTVMVPHRSGS